MKTTRNPQRLFGRSAFTLVEMVAVIVILGLLLVAGIGLRSGAPAASRRMAVDEISAMADRARTTAIGSRTSVALVMAAPADLSAGEDGLYRIGLFLLAAADAAPSKAAQSGTQLGRWKALPRGVFPQGGKVDGTVNPWDSPRLKILTGSGEIRMHGMTFNARGGLSSPPGSRPAVIRIAGNGARGGSETLLRVGRVTGRIYQLDR